MNPDFLTGAGLMRMGITVLGIYFVVSSSADFIASILQPVVYKIPWVDSSNSKVVPWDTISLFGFKLAIGIFLVVKSGSLTNWLFKKHEVIEHEDSAPNDSEAT